VKYSDGIAIMLVSAEDYRFEDSKIAQGIDSIIKQLDKPKVIASSGRPTFLYSPKYRSAKELYEMVKTVGADFHQGDKPNTGAADEFFYDENLNLILFTTSPFSRPTIIKMLKEYDKPYPEVRAKVTVYEIYAENDAQIGFDFQTWKNNDGINLLGFGGRFMRNYKVNNIVPNIKYNDATFFQFNPKWSTKYIDFLTTKGKAKVVNSSEITLRNRTTGSIEKKSQVFYAHTEQVAENIFDGAIFVGDVTATDAIGVNLKGKDIFVSADTKISVLKFGKNLASEYSLQIDKDSAANFVVNGLNVGKKITAKSVADTINLTPAPIGYNRGNQITTQGSESFGIEVNLTPIINQKATTLNVKINNSSLIGYTSNGNPRIQKDAAIDTDFTISNAGTKLVIGGINKKSLMKVSTGLPVLKDIPYIGKLFSTESDVTKNSQMLVVVEVLPKDKADNKQAEIKKIKDTLK
jgi:type II secretory pathway component GspD/PulD (secretin)